VRLAAKVSAGLLAASCCVAIAGAAAAHGSSLPSGFRDSVLGFAGLQEPTAIRLSPDGRVFVAEKAGKILVYDNLEDETPGEFADLRTQVYDSGDRGLLGLALDPGFPQRPYVYALYTFDHVLGEDPEGAYPRWGQPDHAGDECPKPESADVDTCPVSGRLVRLSAEGDEAVAERVLITDWCQQFSSHSVGALGFGGDGALYASGGDGASFYDADYGQYGWPQRNQCGDPPAGIGGTLSPPSAEGGALRAQDPRTSADPAGLDGTIIRVDPSSGEGLPGNPMYGSPDPNARRIIAYGFRNPFRFAIDDESGQIYVGNVGWNTYEEIDRLAAAPKSAFNSGWPCYEGPAPQVSYQNRGLDLCEGLYGEPSASAQPFFFYKHGAPVIPGDECGTETGSAISGLTVYRGADFPSPYDGALFFADSVRGCIYVMYPGDDGRPDPLTTTTFMSEGGLYPGVDVEVGPEGDLYYVKIFGDEDEGTIHRISYDPGAPIAHMKANPPWGAAPLEVEFEAGESTDPDGEPLSYEWDFDEDGVFEATGGAQMTKTFSGSKNRTVAVRVRDGTGASSIAKVVVYPGDTPPQPKIEAPSESLEWRVGQEIEFAGSAGDGEDGDLTESDLYWKARLYHCPSACHAHPLQVFPAVAEGSFAAPDHDYPAHIEISLTATDSRGLSATNSVSIHPRTVDLRIESNPAGLALSAGLLNEAAPFTLRAIEGSHVGLAAPLTQLVGGHIFSWSNWSDGGDRVHAVIADGSARYVASYRTEESSPLAASGRGDNAPQTRLLRHPGRKTRLSTARFAFSAGPGASFHCKLDQGAFKPCRSPRVYRHLKSGQHVFRVVAAGPDGSGDPTPSVFRWRVLEKRD
jgi:glucose/arabinose dehydrogenase